MTRKYNFDTIHDEFYLKIQRYITRFLSKDEAEDLTQIVFEKVDRNLEQFREESKLSTWIYRIATNTVRDRQKSTSYKRSMNGPLAPLPMEQSEATAIPPISKIKPASPEHSLIRQEMSECVKEFIYRLPQDYSTIIILSELEGFTNKEIAEILQISIDAVKIRLHRARAKLKEHLQTGCDFYQDDRSELACDRKQSKPNK